MKIEIQEVERQFYIDVILTPDDIAQVTNNQMLVGSDVWNKRKYFVNLRQECDWDFYEPLE